MKIVLAGWIALLLCGCASVGTPIPDSRLQALEPQVTTIDGAIALLGHPSSESRSTDGTATLIYMYGTMRPNGAAFIPIVGLFAGKTHETHEIVTLSFDRQGRLASVKKEKGNTTSSLLGNGSRQHE